MGRLQWFRHIHAGKLVRVSGVVTKRSSVIPQLKFVSFQCVKCGNTMGPFYQGDQDVQVGKCSSCQSQGPFQLRSEMSSYR